MKRRQMLTALAGAGALSAASGRRSSSVLQDCGCAPQVSTPNAPRGAAAFRDVGSKLRITNMQVFGVTLDERIAQADRPYVFVRSRPIRAWWAGAKRRWKARPARPWPACWTSRT